jgi:hypothetical protein
MLYESTIGLKFKEEISKMLLLGYGAENWTYRKVDQKYLGRSGM